MSNSQASDCYKKLLACAAECEFVASQETKMWYLWFHKAHKVDWKGKIPCLRRPISLQNCDCVPPIIFESAIKSVNAFQWTLSLWASAHRVALVSFIFFVVIGSSRNTSAALHSRWIKFQQKFA